ncbi:MAG: type II toxin-antitoxin system RelE/ParE family toxin [Elusimicrobia bacterium]|nr:type II toxin-antitoxin system RelE/ParE family toxin [Elusimicrobiota bacterium]
MNILQTPEFREWFDALRDKEQTQVSARLDRIREHNHFGDMRNLREGLAELRWERGLRVYFSVVEIDGKAVLVLCGGLKNDQKKDIRRARKILERYARH